MPKGETSRAAKPAPDISDAEEAAIQAGIAADPDNPEVTEAQFAAARPASEVLPPELFAALTKRRRGDRGPGRKPTKGQVTIRLDPAAVAAWRASGPGWQARLNDVVVREAPKSKLGR